ncbi:ATP-dependent helicase HrpB [bacterium]|nr:ATP-dependent helicase HrpB [bacterium]
MKLSPLPIDEIVPDIVRSLRGRPNAVVVAPPGAGKTTRIPLAIAEANIGNGAVAMLQPRRVAARAAAARIATEHGWRIGEEIGYQVRFDNRIGPRSRVRVVTEGILTRWIQSDPFLEKLGTVILDEFHERSIHTDLALALLREIQTSVREDLRIVVMSATMDPGPVARFLGDAPVFESAGRLFPVDIEFAPRHTTDPIWDRAATAVRESGDAATTGHILVFLPGMGEITRTQERIGGVAGSVHILHSSVSNEDQDRALRPSGERKIILATNIAETSLTIDGVRTVIDSGLARVLVNDPRLGIDRLEVQRISRASANQRTGRAGRTAAGRCVRLWTRGEDAALDEATPPEIERIDLAATLLALRAYGISDPTQFGWFESPPEAALRRAEELLRLLGAVDARGQFTKLGRQLANLPLHPRLGCLLIAGAEAGIPREAAAMAALLSERDILSGGPRSRRRQADWHGESDLLERLDWLEEGHARLDPTAARSVRRVRDDLQRLVADIRPKSKRGTDFSKLPLHAYPDRVTLRRENDPSRGVMVGARGVILEPSSVVRHGRLFLSLDPRDVGSEARVSLASAIEEEWLAEVHPDLLQRKLVHRFDEERGRVVSEREIAFAGLAIRRDAVGAADDPEGASRALAEWLRSHGVEFFAANDSAAEFLARVRFLNCAMPDLDMPSFDEAGLGKIAAESAAGRTSLDAIRKLGLRHLLEAKLTWKQREALDRHAPERIEVPSGSRIRLRYEPGQSPVLPVRLQEMFGQRETPTVAGGRVPVVVHLLGPNFRPVQITSDLANFWKSTYAEVRKELRARYPKHPWPEDPLSAQARAVGGRRRGKS